MERFDAIVVGAGAAGMFCAAQAGQLGCRVLLLDNGKKPGRKILMSGGGRCNFTNMYVEPAAYLSQNPHFCKSALARYTQWDFIELVGKYGIAWHEKTLGQLFCDDSAEQIVNLLLARFTKFKYVYLTAHQTYFIALVYLALTVEVLASPSKTMVVIVGGLLLGVYCTLSPALVQPFMRKVTGSNDLAYGHTTSFGVIMGALVGKLFKKHENESSESLKIPAKLSFLKDITVSTAIIMTLLYLVGVTAAGPAWVQENVSGGTAAYMYAISQGVMFGVGITIVLTGVSMMIAEITEAFKGISEKVVPDAVPALDCPVVFNFAPTAVMLGFLSCLGTVIVCVVLFGAVGFYALTPPVITCFFGGGPAGVFGNSTGGWRGAVLAGVVAGLMLSFGQALTVGCLPTTIADFARWSNDFDYSVFTWPFQQLLKLIF